MRQGRRCSAFGRLAGVWAGLFVLVAAAAAQDALSACSPRTPMHPESHAWVVIKDHPDRPGRGRAVLVHIAPRTGELPAEVGSAQLARALDQEPLAVTATGNRVYLAFNGVDDENRAVVRVRSVWAARQGFGWAFEPSDRFTPHPALRHAGGVRSMAADGNLVVLVMSNADDANEVFALVRNDWLPVPLPGAGSGARVEVWPTPRGVTLGIFEGGVLTARDLRVDAGLPMLGEPYRIGPLPGDAALMTVCGAVFATARSEDTLNVSAVEDERTVPVATLGLPAEARFAPVFAGGPRVLALWWDDSEPADGATSLPSLHTVEVSLGTGAVLYDGPLPTQKFISADEFRVLALLLFAVVVGVLILVLRSDLESEAVPLPPGFALAEPARRVVATGIDFAVAAWIVSLAYGVGFWDLVSFKLLFMTDAAWTAIPVTFLVGAVAGTLSEWLSGRTVGKVLTGVRVIPIGTSPPGSSRIPFFRSLVRNAIKWFLPPVAALATMDRQARHHGDKFAGVVVATRVSQPDGPETRG